MLVDFYIPRLSNEMKIAVQKDHFKFCTEICTYLNNGVKPPKNLLDSIILLASSDLFPEIVGNKNITKNIEKKIILIFKSTVKNRPSMVLRD